MVPVRKIGYLKSVCRLSKFQKSSQNKKKKEVKLVSNDSGLADTIGSEEKLEEYSVFVGDGLLASYLWY